MQIRRRLEAGGVEFVVLLQPDGSYACLPAWMTEPEASRFTIGVDEPHFPLDILRAMRAEVDALLGFLMSESGAETADHGCSTRRRLANPCPARKVELAALVELLLREIAATLVQRKKRGDHP